MGCMLLALTATLGCFGTSWRPTDNRTRNVHASLVVRSTPPADVSIGGLDVGRTPLTLPVVYQAHSQRQVRDVTLWKAQPSLATALTVMTAGAYLPSSLFPVRTEGRTESTGFDGNAIDLRLEAPGHVAYYETVVFEGETEKSVDAALDLE
jgi:hypothetical protein